MRALLCLALLVPAHAATIGFCVLAASTCDGVSATTTAAANAITSTGKLAGIQVLWILNPSNAGYAPVSTSNLPAITDWVQSGGVFTMHDRAIGVTQTQLPGGAGIQFTRAFTTSIDIQTGGTYTGRLTVLSLDGGSYSSHGWAAVDTLPTGAIAILNNGAPGQIVDFEYLLGRGAVHYSSLLNPARLLSGQRHKHVPQQPDQHLLARPTCLSGQPRR